LSNGYDHAVATKNDDCPDGRETQEGAVPPRRAGSAFLLAQLGAHAAAQFAERISELDLTPPQAGLLRLIAWNPGQSQQAIAGQLGTPASRLVLLVDGLEERGLIERRRDPADRRHYALYLTGDGTQFMKELGRLGAAHEDVMTDGLTADERAILNDLLNRLAARQGLTAGVHPGYRRT
jgi:DNA-binding MarR family transcriptional regulator